MKKDLIKIARTRKLKLREIRNTYKFVRMQPLFIQKPMQ